jgi:large subunit ribosomal protein L19e
MVVNLRKKRELIARVLDVGLNRVRFEPDKLDDIADAITREDMRSLIKNGTIWTVKIRGISRSRAEKKLITHRKHGTSAGSKKGKKNARVGKKDVYVKRTRAMRRHLKILKARNEINRETFWALYKKIKVGNCRSLSHLRELAKQAKMHK